MLTYRGHEEAFGADNILYLVRGVGYMGVYIHKTSSGWALKIYILYVLNKILQIYYTPQTGVV